MNPPSLPRESNIDTLAFAETLTHADTSYKFFWLLGLLEILEGRGFSTKATISFSEVCFAMLRRVKAPVRRFNFFLGAHDQFHLHLETMERQADDDAWDKTGDMPQWPAFAQACNDLTKYVPFRWARPFVKKEIADTVRRTRNQREINIAIAVALVQKTEGANPPPYVIMDIDRGGNSGIIVHPLWADYFRRNAEVIKGWCLWHLANFTQTRNPNLPAIVAKLSAEGDRTNQLKKQRDFWKALFPAMGGMKCIYSRRELTAGAFELDHYVPWSFVGHDGLWNLIPAHPSVNSSKSDNLPNDRYLAPMVEAHHRALVARKEHFPRKWNDLLDSYVADLKLTRDNLTDKGKLRNAYKDFIPPLIDLAKANRFNSGWIWKSKTPLLEKRG